MVYFKICQYGVRAHHTLVQRSMPLDQFESVVKVRPVGVPLIKYATPAQIKKGLSQRGIKVAKRRHIKVKIKKGKRVVLKDGFVAKMRSGHIGIYARLGEKTLPISERYSTSVADVVRDTDFEGIINNHAGIFFERTFSSTYDYLINRLPS